MSTSGETADLMVKEGIQITESAVKLAGLGAKNLAALLIALANDNQKLAGKTNLKRLIHDGEELTIFSVKKEDLAGFHGEAKRYSAEFLYKCWKRFRKYYATLTGITQNVEACLRSDTARMMFANSEFLLMFNQAPNDREVLAHILNASSAQMSYVSDKPPGHGLIKVGGAIVPLVNEFPKDTSLYWLMTTKPGEG